MTREQIEQHLVNETFKQQARLDLLNKLTEACANCRHHVAPSGKIATAFKKLANADETCYWDNGNDEKLDFRVLQARSRIVKEDGAIRISSLPKNWSWDYVFGQLKQYDDGIKKTLASLAADMQLIDDYLEWHRITRLSIEELMKARPKASWHLSRCFGDFKIEDSPESEPRR